MKINNKDGLVLCTIALYHLTALNYVIAEFKCIKI